MKIIAVLILSFIPFYDAVSEPKVSDLRILFYKSETDKASWEKLEKMVKPVNDKSNPLLICYKGVSEMMGAKYAINPINKLGRFKKGRQLIENAVKREPDNTEIRFLRFSIQTNLPVFLGYNKQIKEDKLKLLDAVDNIQDKVLKKNILTYINSSKHFSREEKKELKK